MEQSFLHSKTFLRLSKGAGLCISLYFLLIALGLITNGVDTTNLLKYTDFNYLIEAEQGNTPLFIYILNIFFIASIIFFTLLGVLLAFEFTMLVILKKTPPKFFRSAFLKTTFVYSNTFSGVLNRITPPFVRSIQRMMLALLITLILSMLFNIFHMWECQVVNVAGGTATYCPNIVQGEALLLSVFIFILFFVSNYRLTKIFSKTKLKG